MNKKYLSYLLSGIICFGLIGAAYADNIAPNKVESSTIKTTLKLQPTSTVKNSMTPSPKIAPVPVTASNDKIIDQIIVFVNKGVITSNQINSGVNQAVYNFKEKGITPPDLKTLRHQVIEQLIMQKIQLDLANNAGIKTSDIEVTDAINNMVKQQKTTLETFKAKLEASGLSYKDFRQQVQDQLTVEKLKQREVGGRLTISENEVNRVLSSELFKHKIEYQLSDVVLTIPEHATEDVMKQKYDLASQALNALKAGQPFTSVVVKYSDSPNALSGGEIGWKSNLSLPPVIAKSLETVPKGGYTNIIQLPMGFFIFKVNDIRKYGEAQMVKQYHVRHILIKVNETRSSDEAYDKIMSIKKLLNKDQGNTTKQNQDFIKYAKEYSEDTSSINGGDLNWVSMGDTVPAFESAIIHTPVGVISEPIHSPFGWHLLEVIGVRDSNLATDRDKAEIRQELRANKANVVYEQWLRDIRDSAYVKMNQD